jgi:hypothetical protein
MLQRVSPCVSISAFTQDPLTATICQFFTVPRGNPREAKPDPKARSAGLEHSPPDAIIAVIFLMSEMAFSDPRFDSPITSAIAGFLTSIGVEIEPARLSEDTFLPGVTIKQGVLLVDELKLSYPGDVLHEAGHLAIVSSAKRKELHHNAGADPGEEMAAIAWSYAAALNIGLDLAIIFHKDGYRGGGQAIIDNFAHGRYVGVPMLAWMGMTADAKQAKVLGVLPYPHMIKWLCD